MGYILQFWMDEVSITDSELFRGRVHPVSALAKYVKDTINSGLEEGYKVTWERVVQRTPWLQKWLYNATSEESKKIRHQPIPVAGLSSDLEVAMERCHDQEVLSLQKDKMARGKPGAPIISPDAQTSRVQNSVRDGTWAKYHLKKAIQGLDWTHMEPKDPGPDVSQQYKLPQQSDEDRNWAGHSPLMNKLLPPGEDVTNVLDYEDDQDPEIAEAIANIPPCQEDVKMMDLNAALCFEPEVGCTGYDPNLVRASDDTGPGSVSPVTAKENKMLDEEPQTRALGMGRPGLDENPGHSITKKE